MICNEIDLKQYSYANLDDLREVSEARNRILVLINSTDIHEDIIYYMLKPFEDILTHNGVNLNETDY